MPERRQRKDFEERDVKELLFWLVANAVLAVAAIVFDG